MNFTPPDRFLRLARPDPEGETRISPRQVYILPTRYGFAFGVLILLMLVGSINYASNLGFMLTFLLGGLGLVAMLHTWRNLVGLELTPLGAKPVFAGQPAKFELSLINHRAVERPGIRLQHPLSDPIDQDLPINRSHPTTLSIPSTQRGELSLGRCTVSTRYPLGLLRAWCYVELESHCLVYPAPGKKMPPSNSPDYKSNQEGNRGVGVDDFVGQRQYRPGDSPKHLNWKALARGQGLQTKQFGGDRAEHRWLDWESLSDTDIEVRLSRLCHGVLDASNRQHSFGLRLPNEEIELGRGMKHRHRCLTALARFQPPEQKRVAPVQ
ncbi:MAG: DUF58 domain-containing protein [Gammaproteobacteria bacterium]|nr:DUF58 domain-containing protein [Gammaproteobacteria bacterium]